MSLQKKKYTEMTVGVLALQGDFERHVSQLRQLGVQARLVKLPEDLDGLNGLIIPGGESTSMSLLLDRFHLRDPLKRFSEDHAVYGTCAGLIMLSRQIDDNQSNVQSLGLLDVSLIRNGYGRQIASFEAQVSLKLNGVPKSTEVVFIRAPKITRVGKNVAVLAEFEGAPILIARNKLLAGSFHSELSEDTALLQYFLDNFVAVPA